MSATVRHVWVRPAFGLVDYPGLLLAWRDGKQGREFLVTFWREDEDRALTDWLTAEQVRPAPPAA